MYLTLMMLFFNQVKLKYPYLRGSDMFAYEVARRLLVQKDSIIYRNRDIDNQTTQGNKERQEEPPINNNHVQISGGLDTINEVYEDDEESEKEKMCVQKKLKLAKNGSVRHKKLWFFDKNEEYKKDKEGNKITVFKDNEGNIVENWGNKRENYCVAIEKGHFYKDKNFCIINEKKNNKQPSITKITRKGKNYTFFCK